MAANELSERLQAFAWVKLQGLGNLLLPEGIGYRSQVGFEQRIITSDVVKEFPLLILPLERYQVRSETMITVCNVTTVNDAQAFPVFGPNPSFRFSYGGADEPAVDYASPPQIQPIDLAWLGPDLTAPLWLPFQVDTPVPAQFTNLELFNALAVLLRIDGVAAAGDFCVSLFRAPKIEGVTVVEAVLPAPEPPPPPP